MRSDGFGRRLQGALADASPSFHARPEPAMRGFGLRLLIALADASPAFRPLRTEELHPRSSRSTVTTVRNVDSMDAIAEAMKALEIRFSKLEQRDDQLNAIAEAIVSREQAVETSNADMARALHELISHMRTQERRREDQLSAIAEAIVSREQAVETSNESLARALRQLVTALHENIRSFGVTG